MIICRDDYKRRLFHRGNVHSFVKGTSLHSAFADTRQAYKILSSSESFGHQCANGNGNHRAEVADHGQFVIARMPSMNIAIAAAHRTETRAEIRARNVD